MSNKDKYNKKVIDIKKNKKGKQTIPLSFFSQAVDDLLEVFPKRSQDIIRERFGINAKYPQTLAEIGKKNNITRERVRQIIQNILRQIIEKNRGEKIARVKKVYQILRFTLSQNSGIIRQKDLLKEIFTENERERGKNVFDLLLSCSTDIIPLKNHKVEKDTLIESSFDFSLWEYVENSLVKFFKAERTVVSYEKILLNNKRLLEKNNLNNQKIFNFLKVSRRIKQNVFGDWGLYNWEEVNPKNIRQKAYLVLKKNNNPSHFKEIANLIDKSGLNKNKGKSHPQTVHNELIKDKRFVLIGRGIYALTEWGYKEGTVKDIIEDVLKKTNQPLSREEIIKKVLSQKQVKVSTININLSNYFNTKNKQGYYLLRRKAIKQ